MKGTTPKKGRPTPKAPQNRPTIIVHQDEVEPRLTPDQLAAKAARERYRAYRKATRFFRRAFGGIVMDQRYTMAHYGDTKRQLVLDARRVYGYIDRELGGVEDVRRVSQAIGMKRGRVLLVLQLVKREVAA